MDSSARRPRRIKSIDRETNCAQRNSIVTVSNGKRITQPTEPYTTIVLRLFAPVR